MARATVTLMEDNFPQVQTWVNSLKKINLFIGVPEENDARTDHDGEEAHIGNVALANMMENGAPSENIPARPFMKPAIDEIKTDIKGGLQAAALYMYQKKPERVRAALNNIGRKGVAAMRRKMESNVPPPLSKETIRKRKARGIRRTNTLIDSKQLWKALGWKIRGV